MRAVCNFVIATFWVLFVALGIKTMARAHDHYTDWMRPDTGTSCCSEIDFYPVKAEFKAGSWWALRREDSEWVRIPDAKILKNQTSPDGKAHLCATQSAIYCFVIPASGI